MVRLVLEGSAQSVKVQIRVIRTGVGARKLQLKKREETV